jgi:hypothetical protein
MAAAMYSCSSSSIFFRALMEQVRSAKSQPTESATDPRMVMIGSTSVERGRVGSEAPDTGMRVENMLGGGGVMGRFSGSGVNCCSSTIEPTGSKSFAGIAVSFAGSGMRPTVAPPLSDARTRTLLPLHSATPKAPDIFPSSPCPTPRQITTSSKAPCCWAWHRIFARLLLEFVT